MWTALSQEIGWFEVIDISLMALFVYLLLVWFRQSRAAFVASGMAIAGLVYLVLRLLRLPMITTVLQGFFTIFLVALVIIFQEEVKYFFEQIASRSFLNNLRGKITPRLAPPVINTLVHTLTGLARERIGALVVLRGKNPVIRHLQGGIDLDGEVSEPILRSIFDPHSAGHDGAVVVRGSRIYQFACHLPLSTNIDAAQQPGTRHSAALGLSEKTDALCLVVSEERGIISAARHGNLREVTQAEELSQTIADFLQEIDPIPARGTLMNFLRRNLREKALAVLSALALWFFLVHEAKISSRTFPAKVDISGLPNHLQVEKVNPAEVVVTLSGPRRTFYFLSASDIQVRVVLLETKPGTWTRLVNRSHVAVPDDLVVESVVPDRVEIQIGSIGPNQEGV